MNNQPEREADIFNAALRVPAMERAAYLDAACSGAAGLRQQVEELLQASEEAGDFLESPASAVGRALNGGMRIPRRLVSKCQDQ